MSIDPQPTQIGTTEIPVQCLPTGDVLFTSGRIGVRYVEAAEVERLREILNRNGLRWTWDDDHRRALEERDAT